MKFDEPRAPVDCYMRKDGYSIDQIDRIGGEADRRHLLITKHAEGGYESFAEPIETNSAASFEALTPDKVNGVIEPARTFTATLKVTVTNI